MVYFIFFSSCEATMKSTAGGMMKNQTIKNEAVQKHFRASQQISRLNLQVSHFYRAIQLIHGACLNWKWNPDALVLIPVNLAVTVGSTSDQFMILV
jgi:hypothetical protein